MICSSDSHQTPANPALALQSVEIGQAASLDSLTKVLPGGAYTTLRTFRGSKALRLEDHFARLERTAAMLEKPLYLHTARLRQAMRAAVRLAQLASTQATLTNRVDLPEQVDFEEILLTPQALENLDRQIGNTPPDFRIRLTLDLQEHPGNLYFALQPLAAPAQTAYQKGVSVITHAMQRSLPKAKLTRFIERSGALRQAMPPDVNETILLDQDGFLLEGMSSNFFAVLDGEIWTAEEGVLSGITRSLVLEGVGHLGLALHLQPVHLRDLLHLQEAFITSSSRAVLPISRIDASPLASAPGPITQKLMQAYSEAVEANLQEIL
jgi:branched-chain amino acid aminotransferase